MGGAAAGAGGGAGGWLSPHCSTSGGGPARPGWDASLRGGYDEAPARGGASPPWRPRRYVGMKCVAGKMCGTPSGWRRGGRCVRCRIAHNDETNKYRGLRGDQLRAVVEALADGRSLEEAGVLAGCRVSSIRARARRDPELAQLLARGEGVRQNKASADRQGAYFAALLASGGSWRVAAEACGLSDARLEVWRSADSLFREAEVAVRALARGRREVPRRGERWVGRSAVPAGSAGTVERGWERPFDDDLLRELWGDPGLSVTEIAVVLEASPEPTWARAVQLGLTGRSM